MEMGSIGYNHSHDENYVNDRPFGAGTWLFLAIKTKAIFILKGKEYHVKPNTFILFKHDFPYLYKADKEEYRNDWFHFYITENEENYIKELKIPINTLVSVNDISDISFMIKGMCFEFYSNNFYKNEKVNLHFNLILYRLAEYMMCDEEGSCKVKGLYTEKLLWLRRCIIENPQKEWSIDEFASDLFVSRSRFQHIYTETFGVNIQKDIINARMSMAAKLLRTTDLKINEISKKCGYNNPAYFMRCFKEKHNVTPSEYRNMVIKK